MGTKKARQPLSRAQAFIHAPFNKFRAFGMDKFGPNCAVVGAYMLGLPILYKQ